MQPSHSVDSTSASPTRPTTARSTTRSASNSLASRSTSRALERLALNQIAARRRDLQIRRPIPTRAPPPPRARPPGRAGPSAGWMSISQSIAVPFLLCRRFQNRKQALVIALFQRFAKIARRSGPACRGRRARAGDWRVRIGCHSFGSPPAIRVVSRQPLAVRWQKFGRRRRRQRRPPARCGKWLVIASAASCFGRRHRRAHSRPSSARSR